MKSRSRCIEVDPVPMTGVLTGETKEVQTECHVATESDTAGERLRSQGMLRVRTSRPLDFQPLSCSALSSVVLGQGSPSKPTHSISHLFPKPPDPPSLRLGGAGRKTPNTHRSCLRPTCTFSPCPCPGALLPLRGGEYRHHISAAPPSATRGELAGECLFFSSHPPRLIASH